MNKSKHLSRTRAGCSFIVLFLSLLIAGMLIRFSEKPQQTDPPEPSLSVRVSPATPETVTATIRGFGVAQPLREATLSAEVPGRVVEMPRLLQEGDRVRTGDILLKLDDRDFVAAVGEASAALAQVAAAVEGLRIQEISDRDRQTLALRSRDLARAEFERVQRLFQEDNIGSASLVDASEQAFTQAAAQLTLLDQALALYPSRLQELEASKLAMQARLERAKTQLERTALTAPFDGRLTKASAEVGDQVVPGQPLFAIADLNTLEIRVPLELSEVRRWLPLERVENDDGPAWFPAVPHLPVRVVWREGSQELSWKGSLHRIINLDATTRSVHVAVRVEGPDTLDPESALPLTAGMFCRVEIPGRELENIFSLPRASVTFDARVYVADENNRLRSRKVEILRAEGERVYVRGLAPGENVITTRLIAPLEGTLLLRVED